jgi:hypothetical protein
MMSSIIRSGLIVRTTISLGVTTYATKYLRTVPRQFPRFAILSVGGMFGGIIVSNIYATSLFDLGLVEQVVDKYEGHIL